jgi:hypothetical protein
MEDRLHPHRTRARRVLAVSTLAIALAASIACGTKSNTHPGTGDPFGGGGGGGGAPPVTTPSDAAVDAAACEAIARGGATIAELGLPGEPTPPLGGTVVAGTYDLIELYAYGPQDAGPDAEENPGTGVTGRSAQITLVVGEAEIQTSAAWGTTSDAGPPPTVEESAVTYKVSGTSLATTSVCPTAGATASVAFSATGSSLVLYPDSTHRQVFARK